MSIDIHLKVLGAHADSGVSKAAPKSVCSYTLTTNDTQRAMFDVLKALPRLPELDQPKKVAVYTEAPVEETLYPLIDAHQVIIVAGAFFGDEGKGKMIDSIAHHPQCSIIARTNSGENAGHTVYSNGKKYVFHLAPSGLLLPGKQNFIGPECVMDPISFMEKEVQQLIDNKIDYKDRLFLGNVHIVTPYHKLLDLLTSAPNSSTLKGMSPIHASKVTKRGPRLDHLFNSEAVLRNRLKRDMETYEGALLVRKMSNQDVLQRCIDENSDGVKRIPDYILDFVMADDKIDFLVNLYKARVRDNPQFPSRCDVVHEIRVALASGKKVLLEGPQSYWLSNAREKFWESSTSADTSAAGLVATAQYNFQQYKSVVINVHKTPGTSRVGIGANPAAYVPQDYFSAQNIKTLRDINADMCKDFHAIQKLYHSAIRPNGIVEPIEFEDPTGRYNIGVAMSVASSRHHGETGATTLKPRVCGVFDCVAHFEVNAVQGPYLTVSALDRGDDYDFVEMTIAYVFHHPKNETVTCNGKLYRNGDIIKAGDPYPSEQALYFCHPIMKKIQGWKDTPIAATRRKVGTPLPQGVCEFIAAIEYFTGARVISIGNGPESKNIIYLKKHD